MLPSLMAVNGVPSAELSLISFNATALPVTLVDKTHTKIVNALLGWFSSVLGKY